MRMNSGLGSPHFFFYAPLAYYIASPFIWLSGSFGFAQLGAAAGPTWLSVGCFFLSLVVPVDIPNRRPGGRGVLPRLTVSRFFDSFGRADFAEFAAMAFTLIGFWVLKRFAKSRARYRSDRAGTRPRGLTNAGSWVTFLRLPLGICYRDASILEKSCRVFFSSVLFSCLLGLGISAFYFLLPALAYRWRSRHRSHTAGLVRKEGLHIRKLDTAAIASVPLCDVRGLCGPDFGNDGFMGSLRKIRASSSFPGLFCLTAVTMAATTIWARPIWLLFPITWTLQNTMRLFVIVDRASPP